MTSMENKFNVIEEYCKTIVAILLPLSFCTTKASDKKRICGPAMSSKTLYKLNSTLKE